MNEHTVQGETFYYDVYFDALDRAMLGIYAATKRNGASGRVQEYTHIGVAENLSEMTEICITYLNEPVRQAQRLADIVRRQAKAKENDENNSTYRIIDDMGKKMSSTGDWKAAEGLAKTYSTQTSNDLHAKEKGRTIEIHDDRGLVSRWKNGECTLRRKGQK